MWYSACWVLLIFKQSITKNNMSKISSEWSRTLTQSSASSSQLFLTQCSKSSSLDSALFGLCSRCSSEGSLGLCGSAAWLCFGLCTTTLLQLSLTILQRTILLLTTCCTSYSVFHWQILHHSLLPGWSSVAQSTLRRHAAESLYCNFNPQLFTNT